MSEGLDDDFARRLGDDLAEELMRRGPSGVTARGLFLRVFQDVSIRGPGIIAPAYELGRIEPSYEADILLFLRLAGGPYASRGELPTFVGQQNRFQAPIPINVRNPRSAQAIESLLVQEGRPAIGLSPSPTPSNWRRVAELSPVVDLRPIREVAANFFGLLSSSLMRVRQALGSGSALITFTVSSKNAGYDLDYWPQYMFNPKPFGSVQTTPVTDSVPANDYLFQGWLNGNVTQDPHLHPCHAKRQQSQIRAF